MFDRSGADVLPRSRRARALLAYLILAPPHAASREALAALLWSERGEEQARASLRQALFELRPLVGADRLLSVTRTEVRLDSGAVVTDLARFNQAAAADDVAAIVAAFGEPDAMLLSDMREIDPAFDEWLAHRRSQWSDARRSAALRACQSAAAERAPAQALRLAQLVALADPLDETAAVAVMTRAHAGGDVAAIRRTYAALSHALRRELGVDSSPATVAIYARLTTTVEPPSADLPAFARSVAGATPPPRWRVRRAAVGLGTATAIVACLALGWGSIVPARNGPRADRPLPSDPAAAALFLQARDDTAERDAGGLGRAVTELERVTHLQPRFAPAYAALADAYLLAGEAGSLSQAVAFDGADHAADRARSLDPELSAAHRARGFVLFWREHRAAAAGAEFRDAIRIDPAEPLTHFWYANVLADAGQQPPALREFDLARLANPGSAEIGADYAWALWIFGQEGEARARLAALLAAHPGNAEALDCAATIALARGDDATFLAYHRRRAEVRGEPTLAAHDQRFAAAFRRGGEAALLATMIADEMAEQQDEPYPDHSNAAFYASLAQNRVLLLRILHVAAAGRERWSSAGFVRRERARWAGDEVVERAINRVTGDRVEG